LSFRVKPGSIPDRCYARLQVEDFDEAERMLQRHGVEYSRHVLPGDAA
jgi:hypothetical protein